MIDSLDRPLLWTDGGHIKGVSLYLRGEFMSMRWEKPSGQIMVTQDNEITEKKMLSLGMKKLGKESVVLEDPEPETHEITQDEMPDNLPMGHDDTLEAETCDELPEASILGDPQPQGSYDPYNPSDPDEETDADGQPNPPEAEKEEQSISPDEVGEMPKDILGG